jgi:hypothetical protein
MSRSMDNVLFVVVPYLRCNSQNPHAMLFSLSCLIRVYRRNLTKSVFIFLLYVCVVQSQPGQEAVQEVRLGIK